MLGAGVGELNVYIETPSGQKILIIKPNDEQSDQWLHGRYKVYKNVSVCSNYFKTIVLL